MRVFPDPLQEALCDANKSQDLLEVVMDLGRLPEARFLDHEVVLSDREVQREDIDCVISRISPFDADNRSGIERTLHRISAIRNRTGEVVGLTCRVGRAIYGTIDIIGGYLYGAFFLTIIIWGYRRYVTWRRAYPKEGIPTEKLPAIIRPFGWGFNLIY